MNVGQVLARKGGDLESVQADRPVSDVIELFATRPVRSVLVTEGGVLVGIVTIRDIMKRIHLHSDVALEEPVRDAMVGDPVTVRLDTPVAEAQEAFVTHGFNHLPVVDEGRPVGMLTPKDVLGELFTDSETTNEYLRQYIAGSFR